MISSHSTSVTVFNKNNIEAIEAIKKMIEKEPDEFQNYCLACGSLLGVRCGEAEPDYNECFCSKGCHDKNKETENGDKESIGSSTTQ